METNFNEPAPAPERIDYASALPSRSLIVSIHDVSPSTFEATQQIMAELDALGVSKVSLLVVPNHHHRGSFLDDYDFCQWLKARVANGDEAVIHGYYHLRNPRKRETLLEKITTRFYTAGEGEFFDIHGAHALQLLSEARKEFQKLNLNPSGFIAPAWLLSEGAEKALRVLHFAYTTRLATILQIPSGTVYRFQSLVWSVRSFWRRICSRIWNSLLFRQQRTAPVLRVSIHPVDIHHKGVWRQVRGLLKKALADRQPITYLEFANLAKAEDFPGRAR